MTFKNIGEIPDDYEHKQRLVAPVGIVSGVKELVPDGNITTEEAKLIAADSKLILKVYDMYIEGKPTEQTLIDDVLGSLEEKIRFGDINPLLGMGFAILSEGLLNISRWDVEFPYLLKNQITYIFHKVDDLRISNPLDIDEVGSFCLWELGIVNYEKEVWKNYLESDRKEADKLLYIQSFMPEGKL